MIIDLAKKSIEELKKIENETRIELFALKFQFTIGNFEYSHKIKKIKKHIARILTIIKQKEKKYKHKQINNNKLNFNKVYFKIKKELFKYVQERKNKTKNIIYQKK